MKRIIAKNINTPAHWDCVYEISRDKVTIQQKIRYEVIALNILDLPVDVVDLGCGTGALDILIKNVRRFARITGVDITSIKTSQPALEKFIQGDVTNTGLKDESFDYAISCEVLEHLEDPQKLVNEMFRLLRKNGKALLTTPLLDKLPSGEHLWEFEIKDVKKMFKKAGFVNIYVFPWSSGGRMADDEGNVVSVSGAWDQIYCFAEKI